jgi:hypothetical protein
MEVDRARLPQAILDSEDDFGGNASDRRSDGSDRHARQVADRRSAGQDDDGPWLVRREESVETDLAPL